MSNSFATTSIRQPNNHDPTLNAIRILPPLLQLFTTYLIGLDLTFNPKGDGYVPVPITGKTWIANLGMDYEHLPRDIDVSDDFVTTNDRMLI